MRIAFSDTRYYVSDPNFGNIPITELLSETYSKLRASLFCPQHVRNKVISFKNKQKFLSVLWILSMVVQPYPLIQSVFKSWMGKEMQCQW